MTDKYDNFWDAVRDLGTIAPLLTWITPEVEPRAYHLPMGGTLYPVRPLIATWITGGAYDDVAINATHELVRHFEQMLVNGWHVPESEDSPAIDMHGLTERATPSHVAIAEKDDLHRMRAAMPIGLAANPSNLVYIMGRDAFELFKGDDLAVGVNIVESDALAHDAALLVNVKGCRLLAAGSPPIRTVYDLAQDAYTIGVRPHFTISAADGAVATATLHLDAKVIKPKIDALRMGHDRQAGRGRDDFRRRVSELKGESDER